jgi:hypothetical protein
MVGINLIIRKLNLRSDRLFISVISVRIIQAAVVFLMVTGQMLQAQNAVDDMIDTDTAVTMQKDSLIRYPVLMNQQRTWTILQDSPIDSVFFRRHNTRFSRELYNLLIRENAGKPANSRISSGNADLASKDGKIIRKIEYGNRNIFAPSVTDSSPPASSGIEKALNALHTDTRDKVLKRHLLLNPSDPLDVFRFEKMNNSQGPAVYQ